MAFLLSATVKDVTSPSLETPVVTLSAVEVVFELSSLLCVVTDVVVDDDVVGIKLSSYQSPVEQAAKAKRTMTPPQNKFIFFINVSIVVLF